jgi:hypothetical protein
MKDMNTQHGESRIARFGIPPLKPAALALALAMGSSAALADLARVGPTSAANGFPLWYQDKQGTVLDLCLPNGTNAAQQAACLFAPPNPTQAYAFPTNFPDEAFYFDVSSSNPAIPGNPAIDLQVPAGASGSLSYLMALEAAFATGGPVAGQQTVFARIRIRAAVPQPGTYTITHPYGVETFQVDTSGGPRDINFTDDVGLTPGVFSDALHSRLGPFLRHADGSGGNPLAPIRIPAGTGPEFLGDGATPGFVTGSPFGTNYIMVCAVDSRGATIPLGNFTLNNKVTDCAGSDQFTLVGRLHDLAASPIGSPLAITRASYGRDDAGTHVDVNANVVKATVGQLDPVLTAVSTNQLPVLMVGPSVLGDYYAQGITDPQGNLPNPVTVINSADSPPSLVTRDVVDVVSISSAVYTPGNDTLTVVATSSDKGFAATGALPPALVLESFPGADVTANALTTDPADVILVATGVATPPASVTVQSAVGGIGRANVIGGLEQPSPFTPGVVFAQDDSASTTASGTFVDIPVIANDVFNPAAPPNHLLTPPTQPINIVGAGLPAANGSLTVGSGPAPGNGIPFGTIRFAPSAASGTFTFQYFVRNAIGASNPATVTLNVATPAGGAVPIATNDGPFHVNPGATLNIPIATLLANDSGNSGTLDPTSLVLSNVTGAGPAGAVVNNATGNVVYTAGNTPGTNFGFDYTVADTAATGGNRSLPAHVTVVIQAENIVITNNRCTRNSTQGQWNVRGTGSIPGSVITLFGRTNTIPSEVVAMGTPVTVLADTTWTFRQNLNNVSCQSPISLQTSLGTTRNIAISIR